MNIKSKNEHTNKVVPNRKDIIRVFFKDIDLSRFLTSDMDDIIEGLKNTVTIWEKDK